MRKLLKHANYRDVEITVIQIEEQHVEIVKTEKSTEGQAAIAWAKEADNPKSATTSYEAKGVEVDVGTGKINFGIAITKSNR
jgi:hypothetical protein